MKENDESGKGTESDLSEVARNRPPPESDGFKDFAHKRLPGRDPSTGSRFLRGCGIAVGIAALLVLFVFGACFIALQH